jgi:glycosyltransferase involved in cell wall biosynthesis
LTAPSADSSNVPSPTPSDKERVDVSVVLPVFNECGNIESLVSELKAALSAELYEIILVDDGSLDGSDRVIESLGAPCRGIFQGRNQGQSMALLAGFDAARGDIVAMLDADGQNDPEDLVSMLEALRSGESLAAVVGYRENRADSRWKRLQSVIANRARDFITGDRVRDTGCSLKVVRRRWLSGLERFDGMHRFIPTLIRMQGGVVIEVPVGHRPRKSGRSNYGMWDRLGRGFRDAVRVRRLLNGRTEPGGVTDAKTKT